MEYKQINRIFAAAVFVITAIVYFMTVQPSVSFWDCGEFIASSSSLQVPHPPGTPFFLILGRFFSMLPFADNIALRINTVSVLSSAFAIVFLYLVAVKLIENYKGGKFENMFDALVTFTAAAIGALSLAFSDTFWFNGVEAEVYANSTFFIAFITYLMVLWNEKADQSDSEKYIIFIAYLLGLSTGVHLMAVLASVPIVMTIIFRKFITDDEQLKQSGYVFMGHALVLLLVAVAMWAGLTSKVAPSPEEFHTTDLRFLGAFAVASVIYFIIFRKKIWHRNSIYIPIILGGITLLAVYPGIVKYIPNLIAHFGGHNLTMDISIFIGIFAVLGYLVYWSTKTQKETLNLVSKAFLFAFLGFTTYSSIIIRSNMDTPINLNSPKTFPELVSYLNREQYGDFPTWKRRFSSEAHQQEIYTQYSSDLDFFFNYQMNHMFHRYLAWNYIGRNSTVQDSGVNWSSLYAIPFLLGLFGIYFHFKRDWKMASIFMMMFIFLGWLTAFYQNQQMPQPRERDYFYVGAFFVFSIWIAIGTRGIFELIKETIQDSSKLKLAGSVFLLGAFLFVPVNMLKENYWTHDRSRNYVPWDYAYNLLQSVKPNAVIFTNGDNDTFPLWYLQDVEGVRQDVRIANLSLLNTPWYIKQLKNTAPYNSQKVDMTLSDAEVDNIQPQRFNASQMSIAVDKETFDKYGITDTSITNSGGISWTMEPTLQYGKISAIRAQDIAALSIIQANAWKRPVYFAVTVSDDSKLGLDNYLIMEGLAHRLVPKKATQSYYYVDPKILGEQIFDEPEGYSKDYQPGFKFRGLNDSTIFFNNNHIRLTQNYRNSFMRLALYYLYGHDNKEMAVKSLDEMEKKLPRKIIPMDYRLKHDISMMYFNAGAYEKFMELSNEVEKVALDRLKINIRDFSGAYNPYRLLKEIYENRGEWQKLIDLFTRLQEVVPNDPDIKNLIMKYQIFANQKDTTEVNKKLNIDNN